MILPGNFKSVVFSFFFVFSLCWLIGCSEKKKENQTSTEVVPEKQTEAPSRVDNTKVPEYMDEGQKVYTQHCLSCHQSDGSGVSRLNPPLKETEYVLGDPRRLLHIIINGSNVGLDIDGETYSNTMPAFKQLSDKDLAQVASYIRNSFGNSAAPVTVSEVSAFR